MGKRRARDTSALISPGPENAFRPDVPIVLSAGIANAVAFSSSLPPGTWGAAPAGRALEIQSGLSFSRKAPVPLAGAPTQNGRQERMAPSVETRHSRNSIPSAVDWNSAGAS